MNWSNILACIIILDVFEFAPSLCTVSSLFVCDIWIVGVRISPKTKITLYQILTIYHSLVYSGSLGVLAGLALLLWAVTSSSGFPDKGIPRICLYPPFKRLNPDCWAANSTWNDKWYQLHAIDLIMLSINYRSTFLVTKYLFMLILKAVMKSRMRVTLW